VLDNWLIKNDHKLEVRPGLIPIDSSNYVFPNSTGQRVNNMNFWMAEKYLFGQTGRKIFTLLPSSGIWGEMSGLGGNDAIQGGDANSQTSSAEFQRQVFLTNDGIGDGVAVQPSKIYQDSTNAWRAKTVGLPRAYVNGTYTAGSLLAVCITNANALRASFIAHMQDSKNPTFTTAASNESAGTALHLNIDKFSLSYLQAETFTPSIFATGVTGFDPEAPSPLPTPAPACTDQASMFTLVAALNNAYTHHITEASYGSINPIGNPSPLQAFQYHMRIFVNNNTATNVPTQIPAGGPFAQLSSSTTPSTLAQAAAMLDDLLQKWNWHRQAVWTHSSVNDAITTNRYQPVCSAIGSVVVGNSTPVVTPDYTDIINYANNLKLIYNGHVSGIAPLNLTSGHQAHGMVSNPMYNSDQNCHLPNATDLNSAYLLIYWIRALYYLHYVDANISTNRTGITFTTNGTTSLTAVTNTSTGAAITLNVFNFITINENQGVTLQSMAGIQSPDTAMVTASGSGTATIDRIVTGSVVGVTGQASGSMYHVSTLAGAFKDSTASVEQATDALSTTATTLGQDTPTWLVLASEIFYCLASHMAFANVHIPAYTTPAATTLATIALTATPFFLPSVSAVSYAYFFSDSYTVGTNGIQYLVRGNPTLSASTQIAVTYPTNYTITSPTPTVFPSVVNNFTRSNVLTNLPVLANTQSSNYDTSNALLNIYRTINGGQTYFLVAQVTNGTTSFTDSVSDTLNTPNALSGLVNNQSIYTTGGTVGADQPPFSKFVHVFNGTVYYGGITDAGQSFPQQIRQSVQFAPDWVPATFSDSLDDDLTGLSSTKSNVIAFCKNSTYRMSGGFSQTGLGAITHDRIADSIGSLNMKGIVKTEVGVFFPGNDGFYYTDGYQVIKISLELDKTYQALIQSDQQKRAIYGAYDKATRRIHWSMRVSPSDTENSIIYVYYLDYGIKPSGVFSTASNFSNFQPASLAFSNGVLYMGHGQGYILKSDTHTKSDGTVAAGATSAWVYQYIPYNWTSVGIDMGTIFKRKYITRMHVVGRNTGATLMQPSVVKDSNQTGTSPLNMKPINYTDNTVWGNAACVWGTASQIWKFDGKFDGWRRFPHKAMRSDFVQLSLTPAYSNIYTSSNDYPFGCNAVVNAGAKTATIQTPTGATSITWYPDVVGYYIYFQTDGYKQGYLITALDGTGKIITYSDVGNLSVSAAGGITWAIQGYKKQQRPSLTSVALTYSLTGDKTQAFPGGASNSGPGNLGGNPS
jgi:hypothetical protein